MTNVIRVPDELIKLIEKEPIAVYRVLRNFTPMIVPEEMELDPEQIDHFIWLAIQECKDSYEMVSKEDWN